MRKWGVECQKWGVECRKWGVERGREELSAEGGGVSVERVVVG